MADQAGEGKALGTTQYVLYRCASDDRVLGEFREGAELAGFVLTRSCVSAGEVRGQDGGSGYVSDGGLISAHG